MKKAFLVGINYTGTSSELRGCIPDVLNIREVLITKYQYSPDNILTMHDFSKWKPTKANIINGWKWLLSDRPASNFDPSIIYSEAVTPLRMFFHYSGHGTWQYDTNGDEADGRDECLCPLDCDTQGMIVDDFIRETLVNKVKSGDYLTAIIDACHSGTAFDLKYSITPPNMIPVTGKYPDTSGIVCMFSGCKDNQTSADAFINGNPSGALTYALITVLKRFNYNISYINLIKECNAFIKNSRISDQIPCLSYSKLNPDTIIVF